MAGIAEITVVGNVGGTPEYGNTTGGDEFIKFSVAVNGRDDKVSWFRVTQFRPHRRFTDNIGKGSLVHVTGAFEAREYDTNAGERRTSLDITAFDRGVNFVGGKRDADASAGGGTPSGPSASDDVPF